MGVLNRCACLHVPLLLISCHGLPTVGSTTVDLGEGETPGAVAPLATGIGDQLSVVGFNVESGDSDPYVVARVLEEVTGESLWGLSEVQSASWMEGFQTAAADDSAQRFEGILGSTGGSDRLAILWDDEALEVLASEELDHINVGGWVRAPLVAHVVTRDTDFEFLFMVNHLYRTSESDRHEQARLLHAWGEEQSLPVIAVGDYNFDWEVEDGDADHDDGYDWLTEDDVFTWVRPEALIKTQCSDWYDAVLDFVFVAEGAQSWGADSVILQPDPQYCRDTRETSDHRPVQALFDISGHN